jgi:hypothetical protein
LLQKIEETMDEKDAGLWEFRNLKQEHCYTFLFHWAGASSVIKISERLNDEDMKAKAIRLKNIAGEKIEACYIPEMKAYSQAIGTHKYGCQHASIDHHGVFWG